MNNSNSTIIKESIIKKGSIERLLDVIASILAAEYIATVRQNPDIFLKQGEIK